MDTLLQAAAPTAVACRPQLAAGGQARWCQAQVSACGDPTLYGSSPLRMVPARRENPYTAA